MLLRKSSLLLHRAHHHHYHDGRYHLHPGQHRLLWMLGTMNGASQKELGKEMGIRPASLSELVDKLELEDLVERRQSREDRRSTHIHLTDRGRESFEEARTARQEGLDGLFQNLSWEECDQLAALLDKVVAGMELHFHDGGSGSRGHGHGMRHGKGRGEGCDHHHRHDSQYAGDDEENFFCHFDPENHPIRREGGERDEGRCHGRRTPRHHGMNRGENE